MEDGPFSSPDFARFAPSVVPFCHVTTRVEGTPRDGLLRELCGPRTGTPTVAYLDPTGRLLALHRGELDVAAFTRFTQRAQALYDLLTLPDPDVDERTRLLEAQLELFAVDPADARVRARRDELVREDASLAARLDGALADARILLLWIERQPRSSKECAELGGEYWTLFEAGARPKSQRALEAFYVLIFDHAELTKQPGRFEAALEALAEQTRGVAGMEGYLRQQRERLAKLKR